MDWRADPVRFVREAFHAEPDAWQADVLAAFPTNRRIAIKGCKGPGKSTVEAWCAWNFLATRPYPKVICTGISGDNLSDGLWSEMAKWQERSPFLQKFFSWNKTTIVNKDFPATWFMAARQWSKSADPTKLGLTLAGKHSDYMLFILDESGGIPDAVMASAEAALASGIEMKILQAGNPTHLEGPLYRACTAEKHLWHVVEITGDPDDPKRSPRISKQWANEQIEKYGRDNPWVLVNVFGRFPPSSLNTLIGVEEVGVAMRRVIAPDQYEGAQKRIGVDVARFGDDSTVLFPRQGLQAFAPVEMRGAMTHDIAARVVQAKAKWGSEIEFVDDTGGYGGGVCDSMLQAGHPPQAVNFSGKSIDPRYINKRAEMWFEMVEWVKRGGVLPNIHELVAELCTPTYTFINGKFQIEPKDSVKERLGRSPNYADALALTFALPEMPTRSTLTHRLMGSTQYKSDWDPTENSRI